MSAGVSVIICCFNSACRLPETLKYLSNQRADVPWEVIIVDNASIDNTSEVAEKFCSSLQISVRLKIVSETRPGLTYARERGIAEARFDVIIFCDDDNWLFPDYVQRSYELCQQYPNVAAIGGEGIAMSDMELPTWFETYKRYYACYPQAHQSGKLLDSTSFLYGAGLIIRKEKLSDLRSKGFKSIMTDRVKTKLVSGGDNELCYALRLCGNNLYYSEDLKFFHFIPVSRLSKCYLVELVSAIAYSNMKLILYHHALNSLDVGRLTWLKDFLYRIAAVTLTIGKCIGKKDSLARKVCLSSSYNSLKAIIHLYGSYRKIFKHIIALKQ